MSENFSLLPEITEKNIPQISGYIRLREEQSMVRERVNGREAEESARDGRGEGERRPMYGQFQQITGKNEKEKINLEIDR